MDFYKVGIMWGKLHIPKLLLCRTHTYIATVYTSKYTENLILLIKTHIHGQSPHQEGFNSQ